MLCIDATLGYVAIQMRGVPLLRAEIALFTQRMLGPARSRIPNRYSGIYSTCVTNTTSETQQGLKHRSTNSDA